MSNDCESLKEGVFFGLSRLTATEGFRVPPSSPGTVAASDTVRSRSPAVSLTPPGSSAFSISSLVLVPSAPTRGWSSNFKSSATANANFSFGRVSGARVALKDAFAERSPLTSSSKPLDFEDSNRGRQRGSSVRPWNRVIFASTILTGFFADVESSTILGCFEPSPTATSTTGTDFASSGVDHVSFAADGMPRGLSLTATATFDGANLTAS
mmetsp:Transcript_17672/g.70946  ORF Transcript_17672/g.70946 Transcript_17672/m.70946 type:complete len:211 (-) Transcript_17672:225-857(-)